MARSDYRYGIELYKSRKVLVIEDLNLGRVTVTNDIENVVEEIAGKERINPVEHMIVYRDSAGIWDGYNFSTRQFEMLQKHSWKEAAELYIELQHNN
jgi:hypothetical protein